MNLLPVSWKNIWRNKLRSAIVIIAYSLGIFGGVFSSAVMIGMVGQRVKLAISNEVSHAQVHHPKFEDNNEIIYGIKNADSLSKVIKGLKPVKSVSSRIKIYAMASTSRGANGVMLNGIAVEDEKRVTDLHTEIIQGEYLSPDDKNTIVIGEKLAEKLKLGYFQLEEEDIDQLFTIIDNDRISHLDSIKGKKFRRESDFEKSVIEHIGEKMFKKNELYIENKAKKFKLNRKIVLQFQSIDTTMIRDAYKVVGIYSTNNAAFDAQQAFVNIESLSDLAGLEDGIVHEIAILATGKDIDDGALHEIKEAVGSDYIVESWKEIMPEIGMYNEYMDFYLVFMIIIVLLALSFGIVNTMLMAVLERIKELGMLMAIGMNKVRVFFMIMFETIMLSLVGSGIGMAISYLAIKYFGKKGIDLSHLFQKGFEAIGFSAKLYPEIGMVSFLQVTLLVILAGFLASIYPAIKAIKLNPAEAIRSDM